MSGKLSEIQFRVLDSFAFGQTVSEIATQSGLTESTIIKLIDHASSKLGANTRVHAAVIHALKKQDGCACVRCNDANHSPL